MVTGTKEKILTEAYRLIHKNGFRATSVEAIAKAAGVKKANVFYYFPTKEALGLELLDQVASKALATILAPSFAEGRHPTEQLRDYLQFARTQMDENLCEGGCPLGNLALEMADVDEAFRQRLARFFETWESMIEGALRQGLEQGVYRETLDPRAMAEFIVSSLEGAILLAKTKRSSEALVNVESHLMTLLESHHL
jgi:TetR/AcrR family transcriptional repressor of nem operon